MDNNLNFDMRSADRMYDEIIKHIAIESDDTLYISTDRNVHVFNVQGDCCSHSYFYEISNVNQLIGGKVIKIEQISMPDPGVDTEYECIQAYGYKIHTDKGYGLIVFRNSSNGYYGGWMEYAGEREYIPSNATEITDDWNG